MFRSEKLQGLLRKHWGKLLAVQALIVFAVGYYVATLVGGSAPSDSIPSDPHAGHVEAAPTLWTCSMHPQIRQPKPGNGSDERWIRRRIRLAVVERFAEYRQRGHVGQPAPWWWCRDGLFTTCGHGDLLRRFILQEASGPRRALRNFT